MKFYWKYRLCLWKSYLDQGMAWTNYLKWPIAFFAAASNNVNLTLIFGAIWIAGSFILGNFLFRYGWIEAAQEVSNRQNLFVKELRKRHAIKGFSKV